MLLVSAGLLARSFYHMTHQNPGFDSHNVLTAGIYGVGDSKERSRFYDQVIARIKNVPGIESAALVTRAPLLTTGTVGFLFSVKGRSAGSTDNDGRVRTTVDSITPDYFETLRIPLRAGREITEQDKLNGHDICVVNEALARRYFGSNEATLGHQAEIVYLGELITPEIVGVVGDTKRGSLVEVMDPSIYLPESQRPWFNAMIVARTESSPVDYTKAVQQAVRETGSDQSLYKPQSMNDAITSSVAQPRFYSQLFGTFAAIAVIMACVGLYGVISYMTSQRTQEIGIRIALGAQKSTVLKLVLSQGMGLVVIGIVLGIGGALAATRFLESMLYGVSTRDILSYFSVSVLLAAVALFACYIPARRATKVDPITALRYE
jgi:putative ABC transport system permease protein